MAWRPTPLDDYACETHLVDVLVTYSKLPYARREIKMDVKVRVLKLIESVIHKWKWVGVLTRYSPQS
jgi:hypothetical protein